MKCSNCGHEQPPVFISNLNAPSVLVNAAANLALPANGPMRFTYNAAAPACAAPFTGTYFVIPCN